MKQKPSKPKVEMLILPYEGKIGCNILFDWDLFPEEGGSILDPRGLRCTGEQLTVDIKNLQHNFGAENVTITMENYI